MKLFRSQARERNEALANLARSLELSPTRWAGARISGKRGKAFVELESREDGVLISTGPILPLPPELRISNGAGEGITLDDAELQAMVHVRAANPAAAIRLLRLEPVRTALMRAVSASSAFELSGGWITAVVTDARPGCSAVLKLLSALSDAAIELSLHAAEEREAAKSLPVPEGGKRFIAVEPLDEVDVERLDDLRREARARLVWGGKRKEILAELRERGASDTLAVRVYAEAKRAHDAIRKAELLGRSGIAGGALGLGVLIAQYQPPSPIHLHSHLPPFFAVGAGVIGWGMYQLGLGVARYVRDGRE